MTELNEVLVNVWRQALVDGAKFVQIGVEKYPVRETSRRRLKQVDFRFKDKELRGSNRIPTPNPNGQLWRGKARG
jgi:hypothetical protein